MSNLLAYLEKHFQAPLWRPLGVRDAEDETEDGSSQPINFGAGSSYRRKNHAKVSELQAAPSISEGSTWNEEDVRRTFMENFGVSVRIVPDAFSPSGHSSHFLFKYYVILQGKDIWKEDRTGVLGDCRGTILRCDAEQWTLAARPFEKFFNQQEVACPVHEEAAFNAVVQESEFVEKADGTMMVLWWRRSSGSGGHWQWSTSTGLVADAHWVIGVSPFLYVPSSASEIPDFPTETQNWNLVSENLLDKDLTYVFELCSAKTQVITRYETERIYLLGVMSISNSRRFSQISLDECAARLKILRPSRVSAASQGLTSLKQTLKWVEDQADPANNGGLFGAWPEGFVMYHKDAPICKLKNRAYVDRHVFYATDLMHMRRLIVDRFFAGTIDDVAGFCPPAMIAYGEEMSAKVQSLLKTTIAEWKALIEDTKTDFATKTVSQRSVSLVNFVRNTDSKRYAIHKFFLKAKSILTEDACRESEASVGEHFIPWLALNYKSFADHWKDTEITELLQEDLNRELERTIKRNWIAAPASPILVISIDQNDPKAVNRQYKYATALLKANFRMATTEANDSALGTRFWKENVNGAALLREAQEVLVQLALSNPYADTSQTPALRVDLEAQNEE